MQRPAKTFRVTVDGVPPPGVEAKDIDIKIEDQVLTVTGHRHFEKDAAEGDYHWIEQQYGTFTRTVTLPRSAAADKIEATYNNGVRCV